MSDREKVIFDMITKEQIIDSLEMSYKYSNVDEENTLVPQNLVIEIIALLKAQEPVKPISCKPYIHTEPITFEYECPICMTGIMRNWVACPICGRAVNWK